MCFNELQIINIAKNLKRIIMKTILKLTFLLLSIGLISSCKNSPEGDKATTGEAATVAKTTAATKYSVNTGATKLTWEGKKITGSSHTGTLDVSGGSIAVEDGMIKGGSFTIDMNSLTNTDLEAPQKGKLEGHLKAADFFDVANFKVAEFQITKTTKLEGDSNANHMIYGNLKLKDVTKEIGFKANVNLSGKALSVSTPTFNIDRTDWNVKYGSDKFFDGLKDKAINDDIALSIKLSANAN